MGKNKEISSKSRLAIALSKVDGFFKPKVRLEQYPTESEITAEVLWNAYFEQKVRDNTVCDMGCGTGILGLGALLLGAKEVIFVDIDQDALDIAKNNYKKLKSEYTHIKKAIFINKDINEIGGFEQEIDFIIQNPPFGAKREGKKHIDLVFLEKAFKNAKYVYSFHKSETYEYIRDYANKQGFLVKKIFDLNFPIKKSQEFHKKRILRIKVRCICFERKGI